MARIFGGFELTINNTTNGAITIGRSGISISKVIEPGASYTDRINAPFIMPNLPYIHLPPTSCVLRYFDTGVLKLQGFVHPNRISELCDTFKNLEPWPIERWPENVGVYNDLMAQKGMVAGTYWYNSMTQQNFCISTIVVGWYGPYSRGIGIVTTKGNVVPTYRVAGEYESIDSYYDLDAIFEPGLERILI